MTLFCTFVSAVTGLALLAPGNLHLLCSTSHLSGANVEHAGKLVSIAALAAFVVAIAVRNKPRLMVIDLLLVSGALLAGIVLVALDSAVRRGVQTCSTGIVSFAPPSTKPVALHVWFAYGIWSVAIFVLLWQAVRLLRTSPVPEGTVPVTQ